MHSYARYEAKPSTSRTPIGARWPSARAALPHTDQFGSAAAPCHWDSHQMNECCKSIMFVTPRRAARCRRGRFARARPRTPSPAASSVSITPQQQVEHVHLLVATRLVAEHFDQQRQLKSALPNSRWRRRAVRTHHQQVRDIHTPFHTRGRRRRTNGIANAPCW